MQHSKIEQHGLQYDTPFFLCDPGEAGVQYDAYARLFPGAQICYAMKANAEEAVLTTLRDAGSSFEVAGKYELQLLKDLHVLPEKITFGTATKEPSHIEAFHAYGVKLYAVDNLEEIERVAVLAPGAQVYVRVIVDQTGSVFKLSEKFGTSHAQAVKLLVAAKEKGLVPYGFSFHVGSQASRVSAWGEALASFATPMRTLERMGIRIHAINIGGGFPWAYKGVEPMSLDAIAADVKRQVEALPYPISLMLEPGRGIVAPSLTLVTSVFARVTRSNFTWLHLDAGVYQGLFETMAYQGATQYHVRMLRESSESLESFALAGPTGDSPDVISRNTLLPRDITSGDRLVFEDVGAYSLIAACPHFHRIPRPPVYMC